MNAITYASGNFQPDEAALRALRHMLAFIGMYAAYPLADEPFSYDGKWQRYEAEVAHYKAIANSAFYIVYCDDEMDERAGLQLLYAMLRRRPVVITGELAFAPGLNLLAREIIGRHRPAFHQISIAGFELAELSLLLGKLRPVTYPLSKREEILAAARVRQTFRQLLDA